MSAGSAAVGLAWASGPPLKGVAAQASPGQQVFFGWLLGSTDIIAVALDLAAPDESGARVVKAYVCDGLGMPDGIALWFKDTVVPGEEKTLTTAGGDQLVIDAVLPTAVTGSFTINGGVARRFASFRAVDGAGIYDVILGDDLRYAGTSSDGSVLAAKATTKGKVTGTITTPDGTEIRFAIKVLLRLSEDELATKGLPVAMHIYEDVSLVPDVYTAVIAPGGTFWLGRSGDIRNGSPGPNIIGLDMCVVTA